MIRTESKATVVRNTLAPGQPTTMPISPVFSQMMAEEMAKIERGTTHNSPPYILSKRGRPASGKVVVSIRLDPAVIAKFKAARPEGWQALINDVLMAAKV